MESLLQLKQALDAGLITQPDYDAGKHAFLRAQQVCGHGGASHSLLLKPPLSCAPDTERLRERLADKVRL